MLTLKQKFNHAEGERDQVGIKEEGGEARFGTLILRKPHAVKKPYNMEQITCHEQKRNGKERQWDELGWEKTHEGQRIGTSNRRQQSKPKPTQGFLGCRAEAARKHGGAGRLMTFRGGSMPR